MRIQKIRSVVCLVFTLLLTGFAQTLVAVEGVAGDVGGTQVVFLDGFEERVCAAAAGNLNVVDSTSTPYPDANWKIARGPSTANTFPVIQTPGAMESAVHFDVSGANQQVAGFLVSRSMSLASAAEELESIIAAIGALDAVVSTVETAKPGFASSGPDFNAISETIVHISSDAEGLEVVGLRSVLIPALLGRPTWQVAFPPVGWLGTPDTEFVLVLHTLHREVDSQLIIMGALTRREQFYSVFLETGIHARDFGNGTAVSESGNAVSEHCIGPETYSTPPSADIIWVADESSSMLAERTLIADESQAIFAHASRLGLDFRMGVTDMNDTGPGGQPGIFTTRQQGGTGDRWILPGEHAIFADGIKDPSGQDSGDGSNEHGLTSGLAALDRHTPRNDTDQQMVRESAGLYFFYLTDEKADEIEDAGLLPEGVREPTPGELVDIDLFAAPYVSRFNAQMAKTYLFAEALPFAPPTCSGGGAEYAYGYYSLVDGTGGRAHSICPTDMLDDRIRLLVEDITGELSPVFLPLVPISGSIEVSRNGSIIPRLRQSGWDYNRTGNSILFFGIPYGPESTGNIEIAFKAWD